MIRKFRETFKKTVIKLKLRIPMCLTAMTVNCTEPCLVTQYNKARGADFYQTDSFMMLVTPVSLWTNRATWRTGRYYNQDEMDNNYVNIVVPFGKSIWQWSNSVLLFIYETSHHEYLQKYHTFKNQLIFWGGPYYDT